MSDKEVVVIQKEIAPILKEAISLKIVSQEDMVVATEVLSNLNKIADRIEKEKQKVLAPLNAAAKAERARWKPIEVEYETAINSIREEMSAYQTEQVRLRKEAEAKIANRIGEGKGKFKIETAVRKLDEVAKPEQTVATQAGIVSFREIKRLKVTDETQIPREYLIIDEKRVLEALKSGISIPGAELETVQVPANYR